nr:Chain B, Daxx [Homo sapiens]4WJQ_D Chain D, Daxx [Homo sapiens]
GSGEAEERIIVLSDSDY